MEKIAYLLPKLLPGHLPLEKWKLDNHFSPSMTLSGSVRRITGGGGGVHS